MGQHVNPLLFEEEHLVRTTEMDGELWFVGLDVCRILEIRDHKQALERLDDDERRGYIIPPPSGASGRNGGHQDMIVVSEPGVYRLVFTSRKPIAERFKRWLAHDVIPTIRKTGHFGSEDEAALVAPVAETRVFPDWPMEELRTKKGVVDMYRLLYGSMAAQWVSPQLGFPTPPRELVEHGRQFSLALAPQAEAI